MRANTRTASTTFFDCGTLPASSSRHSQFGMHAAFPVNDQNDLTGLGIGIDDDFVNEGSNEAFLCIIRVSRVKWDSGIRNKCGHGVEPPDEGGMLRSVALVFGLAYVVLVFGITTICTSCVPRGRLNSDHVVRRPGTALAIDQPEAPFFDQAVVLVERISPPEHDRPDQAVVEYFFKLPIDEFCLALASVPETALAKLSQQERKLAGQMLEVRKVRAKPITLVKIDVERENVDESKLEIFGCREVRVRYQMVWVLLTCDVAQLAQEALNFPGHM